MRAAPTHAGAAPLLCVWSAVPGGAWGAQHSNLKQSTAYSLHLSPYTFNSTLRTIPPTHHTIHPTLSALTEQGVRDDVCGFDPGSAVEVILEPFQHISQRAASHFSPEANSWSKQTGENNPALCGTGQPSTVEWESKLEQRSQSRLLALAWPIFVTEVVNTIYVLCESAAQRGGNYINGVNNFRDKNWPSQGQKP